MRCRYDSLLESFKEHGQPDWNDVSETSVLEPYTYLLNIPGKDIRTTLIHAFNVWLEVPEEGLDIVLHAIKMLHTASLLIDDVEDESELRRGQQAAHLKFGPASTINAANYIYFSAMALIRKTKNTTVITIYEEEILNLHRGQGLELYWRDRCKSKPNFVSPTEAGYLEMVNDKTGGLLRMAIRLLQALSPHESSDYVPLANMVGILFQVRDDYMNLASLQYCKEKGFCEDLTEGKFSFPIIHGIRADHELSARLREILFLKTSDLSLKIEACEILRQLGSLDYTIKAVSEMKSVCKGEVSRLGGNAQLSRILDVLSIDDKKEGISETVAFAKTMLVNQENEDIG